MAIASLVIRSNTKFSAVYRGGHACDVVILGNSRADASFCPPDMEAATGLSVFQLGHKGTSAEIAECLWADYLERTRPPGILLVEVTCVTSDNDPLYDLKAYGYWSKRLLGLLRRTDPAAYAATAVSRLFLWNGEVLFSSLYHLGRSDQARARQRDRRIDAATAARMMERSDVEPLEPREANLPALRRIVDLARASGCRVCLVVAPFWPDYARKRSAARQELLANIRSCVGEGVRIADYGEAVEDPAAFENIGHLNGYGTTLLLRRIVADGLLGPGPAGGVSPAR
jgi:hypothetical protein